MDVQLVTQPYEDSGTLAEFLDDASSLPAVSAATFVVAWAKRSGLTIIRPALETFKSRGIPTSLIVGIDQGGATRQGLELALASFDSVHVLHDHGRTFHPKLYWIAGAEAARLFIGSNNLTEGGVRSNYEVALQCDLDLTNPSDARLQQTVLDYIDRLLGDVEICKPLSSTLLIDLLADGRYVIGDEDAGRTGTTTTRSEGDAGARPSIFGRSAERKKARPASPRATEPHETEPKPETEGAIEPTTPPSGATLQTLPPPATGPQPPLAVPAPTATVEARWYKRLRSSDAQHPPNPRSNPTGNLRLNKAGADIDWRRYFRDELFGSTVWTAETIPAGVLETTAIPFEVTIAGSYIGLITLIVDYGAYREADQANVTTVLHWGSLLPALRATSYIDYYVVIERLSDGSFHLTITDSEPAGYL